MHLIQEMFVKHSHNFYKLVILWLNGQENRTFQTTLAVKRYSVNSIETYTNAFRQFLMHFKGQDVDILN